METDELLKKVRKIQILTQHLVSDTLAGNYHSAFRGTGMEFDEVREYQPGDDVRSIDWNVTARSDKAHVKRFTEEREMTVLLLVDGSSSVNFGSTEQSKMELASEIAATLAFSATKNNDKVGLILFTDKIDLYLPPKKGTAHVLRVIREVLSFEPRHAKTDIRGALEFLGRVQKKRATTFLISDFFDSDFDQRLSMAAGRHDLIAVRIGDKREREIPPLGLVRLEDVETGEQILVDSSSPLGRELLARNYGETTRNLDSDFRKRGMDSVALETGENYLMPLRQLFKKREKKR